DRTSVARLDNARPINPQVPSKPFYGGGGNRTRVHSRTERASTSVGGTWISPAGRSATALPTGQPSFSVAPPAIGVPSAPSPFVGAGSGHGPNLTGRRWTK